MTTLTMQDEKRIEIIQRVFRGELTVVKAAVILGISERQCYRIKQRINQEGVKGVIHGNRRMVTQHRGVVHRPDADGVRCRTADQPCEPDLPTGVSQPSTRLRAA